MTNAIKLTDKRYRLGFHIMAPSGWINDPNGFVYFKGYYHIFYQHNPNDSKWGPMHWGHARSKDLVHWETLPIALTPGDKEDEGGCFSGSAVVKDEKLYLIYTGHHYYNDGDPEHIWQNQNMAISEDGIYFKKYEHNPIIAHAPEDNTENFRDPKVWYNNGKWYLVLGSQNKSMLGRVLLYSSDDLFDWKYLGVLAQAKSKETEGDMWECPDFFRLNDNDILVMSPQGIKTNGSLYKNFRQTGYLVGEFNYSNKKFNRGMFTELDNGHDFYATQTTLSPDGRRIIFGWMDMWDSPMPESEDGWAGALTIPRELIYEDGILKMKPISELAKLRTEKLVDGMISTTKGNPVVKNKKQYEAIINYKVDDQSVSGISLTNADGEVMLKIIYDMNEKKVVLNRKGDDPEREAQIKTCDEFKIHLFVDTSSVEVFINDGERTFSERVYANTLDLNLITSDETTANVKAYSLEDSAIQF